MGGEVSQASQGWSPPLARLARAGHHPGHRVAEALLASGQDGVTTTPQQRSRHRLNRTEFEIWDGAAFL